MRASEFVAAEVKLIDRGAPARPNENSNRVLWILVIIVIGVAGDLGIRLTAAARDEFERSRPPWGIGARKGRRSGPYSQGSEQRLDTDPL